MCNSIKTISRVKSGELSFCTNCKSFHLIFNNLFFALTKKELKRLKSYVDGIEVEYWEHKYACANMERKIPIPSNQENLIMMFNRQEITELQTLLSFTDKKSQKKDVLLGLDDIDYNLILN
ncbi:DUF6686 family protein [Winogradskyella haliclonae]|uniref:Uncharacterized protein n=1 Tax=Winogradskyella haliclonae TaxID=2048558 RepID=A0ABQ2BXP1_9FLAO|nr:DUF6686 family protein [Winogradskyella haliclonae]GGI57240.1 hypothetical protein GCM10011444_15490 [Winogradskyella haliclonae]